MSLLDTIMGQLQSSGGLEQIGSRLGTDRQTAGNATAAAVASLLGALAKNSSSDRGAEALTKALSRDHDGSILNDLTGYLSGQPSADGNAILGHVLGPKRQALERGIGKSAGIDGAQVAQLLTMLAPLVMGALGRTKRSASLDAGGLASMLGREREQISERQPQAMNALAGLLDTDGDGDVDFGDLAKHGMGMLGKLFKK